MTDQAIPIETMATELEELGRIVKGYRTLVSELNKRMLTSDVPTEIISRVIGEGAYNKYVTRNIDSQVLKGQAVFDARSKPHFGAYGALAPIHEPLVGLFKRLPKDLGDHGFGLNIYTNGQPDFVPMSNLSVMFGERITCTETIVDAHKKPLLPEGTVLIRQIPGSRYTCFPEPSPPVTIEAWDHNKDEPLKSYSLHRQTQHHVWRVVKGEETFSIPAPWYKISQQVGIFSKKPVITDDNRVLLPEGTPLVVVEPNRLVRVHTLDKHLVEVKPWHRDLNTPVEDNSFITLLWGQLGSQGMNAFSQTERFEYQASHGVDDMEDALHKLTTVLKSLHRQHGYDVTPLYTSLKTDAAKALERYRPDLATLKATAENYNVTDQNPLALVRHLQFLSRSEEPLTKILGEGYRFFIQLQPDWLDKVDAFFNLNLAGATPSDDVEKINVHAKHYADNVSGVEAALRPAVEKFLPAILDNLFTDDNKVTRSLWDAWKDRAPNKENAIHVLRDAVRTYTAQQGYGVSVSDEALAPHAAFAFARNAKKPNRLARLESHRQMAASLQHEASERLTVLPDETSRAAMKTLLQHLENVSESLYYLPQWAFTRLQVGERSLGDNSRITKQLPDALREMEAWKNNNPELMESLSPKTRGYLETLLGTKIIERALAMVEQNVQPSPEERRHFLIPPGMETELELPPIYTRDAPAPANAPNRAPTRPSTGSNL